MYETGTKDSAKIEFTEVELYGEQILTFAITGTVDDMQLVTIIDDINIKINPDEAMVRIFNLTHDVLTYDIVNYIFSSLSSNEGTEYTKINPGRYLLEIRPPHRSHKIAINITIKPGKIYTIYILESMPPNSPQYQYANIYQVIQVVDGNTVFKKCIL